ncbi:iron-siderophore ABC transporter substrate-binding protein [Curtobacterium sp. Leaf261]|uniref:iron-siderophore ABC transporter substrate-binding protein n=1 Tax=Curtobacterium sp. Leaf261 TaxID=1736311 RepID=UPI0006F5171B|nr:iron-siderophore ABC transporter substrate-binding protein [Curtobacterium sp. Leaf261]KQO61452.1 ABC transporter substrate-binding protein [Curtobacterium sp. Leaf261]
MTQTRRPARRLRSVLAVIGAAVAATLVLAGCSAGSPSSGASASSDGGAFPARVTTAFGTTTVDAAPKRVVALGWGDAETALALGVQPVGASDWLAFGGDGVGPWLKNAYTKSPKIIGTLEPSYESIVALKPDLILDVNSSGDKTRYDTLSKIAPTVAVPKGGANYAATTAQQVTMIAKALGKVAKGKELLQSVDTAFAAARKAHPEFEGKTAVIGAFTSEGYGAYSSNDTRVQYMKKLGFTQPKKIDQLAGDQFSAKLSDENLDLLDADLTVILPIYQTVEQAEASPLFQKVPSVEAGHDIVFQQQSVRSAFSAGTVPALLWSLKRLPDQFSAKLG